MWLISDLRTRLIRRYLRPAAPSALAGGGAQI
jgi:hypothetical protein